MHAHVVADIDDRRDLGADGSGIRTNAEKETGTADAPGQDHDPHESHPPAPAPSPWLPGIGLLCADLDQPHREQP
ncbi:hypothetical protein Aph02nite_52980 [Actinoplanes philippinensis]|nr:hypothetical protein Aph02nite_52980 [Actinoplanes philippinensis]